MAFSAVTERGSNAERTSDTSLGVSPSADLTVDKIVFAVLAFDNIATTDGATTTNDTLTDTDGHTWTKVAERTNTAAGVANDGVTGALWWTKVTTQIDTTDTITFDVDSAVLAKVIGLFEVTVGAGQTIQLVGSAFVEDDGTTAPLLNITGLAASTEHLFIGVWWRESNVISWTEAVNFFNVFAAEGITTGAIGGAAAANVSLNVAYRIATVTNADFDPAGLTSTQNAGGFFAFKEVAGAGTQSLTGALFTKAPTFFTGAITATYNLAGALFTKAPTFFTGTVTATRTLTGVLFTKAPTFPTGAVSLAAGPQTVNGVLFTKAPTFPQGAVTSTYALTGTLFVKAPTFFTGTVTTGAVTLTGSLFVKAPTFPQGAVTAGAVSLTGVLFQKAPTFPTGTVTAGAYPLTGNLFVKAPTFFTGTIGQAGTLFGTLFVKAPTFFTGSLTSGAPSFWQPDPAGWIANPSAFVRVGRYGPSPWGAELSGQRFEKAPTFPAGVVS